MQPTAQELTEQIDNLRNAVIADPYCQAWAQKLRSDEESSRARGLSPMVETPADVLGERALFALTALDKPLDVAGKSLPPEVGLSMAHSILSAIPFYWANSVDSQIRDLPLPRFIIGPKMLPATVMWISLQGEQPASIIFDQLSPRIPANTQAILVSETPTQYAVLEVVAMEGQLRFNIERLKIGSRYPDNVHVGGTTERLLKFLAFVNSPYTETEKMRSSRADRRRAIRAGWQYEPEVHVVKLRARVPQQQSRDPSDSTGTHLWQHRWWVRGHFRAQWYASENAHRVIWIAPFVKGPDDKPFKSAVYTVVR